MDAVPSREAFLQLFGQIHPMKHLYLMGGFAEDALLDQRIRRERADVDFLVKAESWDESRTELKQLGIVQLEPLLTGPAGEALAFRSNDRGFLVEVWPATRASDGYAIVPPGSADFFRLHLPADTFDFAATTLDGVRVQTISPRALALFRATSAQTRGEATDQAADRYVVQRIATEVLPGHVASDLTPDIRELPAP